MALFNKARQTLFLTFDTIAAVTANKELSALFYEKFLVIFGVAL